MSISYIIHYISYEKSEKALCFWFTESLIVTLPDNKQNILSKNFCQKLTILRQYSPKLKFRINHHVSGMTYSTIIYYHNTLFPNFNLNVHSGSTQMTSLGQKHDTLIVRVAKIGCIESAPEPSISHLNNMGKIDNQQFSYPQLSDALNRHLKRWIIFCDDELPKFFSDFLKQS